jgi:hypothetical protein
MFPALHRPPGRRRDLIQGGVVQLSIGTDAEGESLEAAHRGGGGLNHRDCATDIP